MVRVTPDYVPRNNESIRSISIQDDDVAGDVKDYTPSDGLKAIETVEQQQNECARVVSNSTHQTGSGAVGRFCALVEYLGEKKNKNKVIMIDREDFDCQRIL